MLKGIDISNYQGNPNFDVLDQDFIIIKSTEGTGYRDPAFYRNQQESRRVNLPLGYYHFARPDLGNTPESEGDYFLSQVKPLPGEILVLDYEPNWDGDAPAWCQKWLDYIYSRTNCRALIYLNQSQTKQYNWKTVIDSGYGLWIAAYTDNPDNNNAQIGAWPFAAMQQYTNKLAIPGIPGAVDGDVFFGDVETFKKYGIPKPPEPTPSSPDINWTDQTKIPLNLVTSLETYDSPELGVLKSKIIAKDQEIKTDREGLAQASDNLNKVQSDLSRLVSDMDNYKRAYELQTNQLAQKNAEIENLKDQLSQSPVSPVDLTLKQLLQLVLNKLPFIS